MKQKTLDFFVDEQFIRAPHHRVVADSRDYLTARFSFGEAWQGLTKTAVFLGADGRAYHMLLTDDACAVPPQVLRPTQFFVSVFGGDRLTTDRVAVEVVASGFVEGITPPPTTADIYTQLTQVFDTAREAAQTAATEAEKSASFAVVKANQAQEATEKANASVVAAAVSADSAESYARASGFFSEQSTASADAAKASEEGASASAAAAAEDAASAVSSATAAEQSATAAGQSAAAAAASAAGAVQSAAALENVGALTLIDSVTLTEEVAEYIKDLPAETYRELYVTATEKLGGTVSDKLVRFVVQDGNRVCGIDAKSSAGKTMYVAAHLVTLPGKGHAGIIGVGVGSWINATTSMSPGILDSEEQDGYIRRCRIAVNPSYADTGTVTLAAGTKIMIWGR